MAEDLLSVLLLADSGQLDDDDAIPAPPPQIPQVEYNHRPEPFVTPLERQTLYSERAPTLLRRRASLGRLRRSTSLERFRRSRGGG